MFRSFHKRKRDWGYSGYQLGLYALLPEFIRNLYSPNYKPDLPFPAVLTWSAAISTCRTISFACATRHRDQNGPEIPMLGCIGVAAPVISRPPRGLQALMV
jgi:amidase